MRTGMKTSWNQGLFVLALAVLCIVCRIPSQVFAAEAEQKTVRVGYVDAISYEEMREQAWLAERNHVLRMGFLDNNLPYSNQQDDGTVTGIMRRDRKKWRQ